MFGILAQLKLSHLTPLFLSEWVKVTQSCLTLYDPLKSMEFSWPEYWSAFPFSRRSSQHRNWTQVSHIAGKFFTSWATTEVQLKLSHLTPLFLLYLKISRKFQSILFCFQVFYCDLEQVTGTIPEWKCYLSALHYSLVWNKNNFYYKKGSTEISQNYKICETAYKNFISLFLKFLHNLYRNILIYSSHHF